MKELFEKVDFLSGEVYCMIIARDHYTLTTKELFKQYESLSKRLQVYHKNGYTEKDKEDLKQILSELERIEAAYWEDCKNSKASKR